MKPRNTVCHTRPGRWLLGCLPERCGNEEAANLTSTMRCIRFRSERNATGFPGIGRDFDVTSVFEKIVVKISEKMFENMYEKNSRKDIWKELQSMGNLKKNN